MTVSSLPSHEVVVHTNEEVPSIDPEINYSARATCHRRTRTRRGPKWVSSDEMSLRDAILFAVRKFRIGEDSAVTSEGLSLYGIDAILAVRERPDFPEHDAPTAAEKRAAEIVIDLGAQRRRRDRKAGRPHPSTTRTAS